MRRLLTGAGGSALAAALLLACGHSADSDRGPNPAALPVPHGVVGEQTPEALAPTGESPRLTPSVPPIPPLQVTADKLSTLLLPSDVAGPIIGSALGFEMRFDQPAPALDLGDRTPCAALFGPNINAYGLDWTAYRGVQQKSSDENAEHVVGQGAATYLDAGKARTVFTQAFPTTLSSCDAEPIRNPHDADPKLSWRFRVAAIDAARARWTRTQVVDGQPVDWSCAYEAKPKNNVVLYTSVCERGLRSVDSAAAVMDRLQRWVPES